MGSAASVEATTALKSEAEKPVDATDLKSGKEALEEVKRLRAMLHTLSAVTPQEAKGLEVVWNMLSEGQHTIDVPTLMKAYQKMVVGEVTEEGVRGELKAMDVAETMIDFDAFVRFFAMKKKHGPMAFGDIDQDKKGHITSSDLKRAISLRPTFQGMDFDDSAAEEIIQCASPTGKVDSKAFAEVQTQLEKRKAVFEAFKLWDANGDGEVDIRDILQTLKSHGEEMSMEEAREILAECDHDKDGVINFKDFQAVINRPSFDTLPF